MKKIIVSIMILFVSLGLYGCTNTSYFSMEQIQSQVTDLYTTVSPMTVAVVSYDDANYQTYVGHGSGLIYDRETSGSLYTYYIITNYHVVEYQAYIKVYDGTDYYEATPYAVNEAEDLALVTISTNRELAYYGLDKFNASFTAPNIGEFVLAVGTPLDLSYFNTATLGIVSLTTNSDVIQHDAAINPGNSGGPLFDLSGNLVGFNTWKKVTTISDGVEIPVEGMGYAISMSVAQDVISTLRNTQESVFTSAKLGIRVLSVEDAITNIYGGVRPEFIEESQTTGVYVHMVIPLRPSYGKILVNDIIISIDGTIISTVDDISAQLSNKTFGSILTVTVRRYENGAFGNHILTITL